MPKDRTEPGHDTELESRVRQMVEEIESGEGDERWAADFEGEARSAGRAARRSGGIEPAVRQILTEIGEDPTREGLLGTPARMHRMWLELTCGYHVDPERLINGAVFDVDYSEMVVVRDIPFYSLCEHHLLPFMGRAHVAYLPAGKVIGLSKIPRIVEMFARRLQLQERMTQQIADFLEETLHPHGVAVVCEAVHLCAAMRGVKKANTRMITSAMLGTFKENEAARHEFFSHVGK